MNEQNWHMMGQKLWQLGLLNYRVRHTECNPLSALLQGIFVEVFVWCNHITAICTCESLLNLGKT